jgi:hypothetical protein
MKKIDLNKSVHDLTQEHPELIGILKDLGFSGVANPVIRRTLGKITTIPEGCKRMGKDLNEVIKKLKGEGFEIEI